MTRNTQIGVRRNQSPKVAIAACAPLWRPPPAPALHVWCYHVRLLGLLQMAANRGEIALRIMRGATELGCQTLGIYAHEDRFSPHRFKADESFMVSRPSLASARVLASSRLLRGWRPPDTMAVRLHLQPRP